MERRVSPTIQWGTWPPVAFLYELYSSIIFMVCIAATFGSGISEPIVNVLDSGAVGDGTTDDSQAFLKAWETVCGAASDTTPTLIIPEGKTFLLKPLTFEGPCGSTTIHVQVGGDIIAPSELSDWDGFDPENWIVFRDVNGLTVDGNGQIDGKGAKWWEALMFSGCNSLTVSGLRHTNSQKSHISITECDNVFISSLHISAPEDSPNTDGIDISRSTNILINNTFIGTGDDCVAINNGSAYINITWVTCGPGHGISVGSLGKDGEFNVVEEIYVEHCTFNGSDNGARIKTWQGGSGYAKKITYQDITLINTDNPIFIDQFYCPDDDCNNKTSAVNVSDVLFANIYGTSEVDTAIQLLCNGSFGCTNVRVENVNITASGSDFQTISSCENAHGSSSNSNPQVDCLLLARIEVEERDRERERDRAREREKANLLKEDIDATAASSGNLKGSTCQQVKRTLHSLNMCYRMYEHEWDDEKRPRAEQKRRHRK
nr:probable polygalacturonase At3g15720 [Ziziphus jujuba var. spinosa]